jgi:Fe-S-cluster-containing dehydrogenase component
MNKLYIDIPALINSGVDTGAIDCEYGYHRNNDGVASIMEVAEFAAYCRQCPEAFCVESCPKEALERLDSGVVKRYNMRCVGCKSCILACPFGTIFPEVINYLSSKCDFCLTQLNDNPDYIPACAKTAPAETFQMKEVNEDPDNYIFNVGEHLAVKSPSWRQKEGRE